MIASTDKIDRPYTIVASVDITLRDFNGDERSFHRSADGSKGSVEDLVKFLKDHAKTVTTPF